MELFCKGRLNNTVMMVNLYCSINFIKVSLDNNSYIWVDHKARSHAPRRK